MVIYTVPTTIIYKDDPRNNDSTITSIAKVALRTLFSASGEVAATAAHQGFIDELNAAGLPFRAVTAEQMQANAQFSGMDKTGFTPKPKPALASALMALSGGESNERIIAGEGPRGLTQFGLNQDYLSGEALTGERGEHDYVQAAIKALGVDAALVVADPGFSFACKACIGIGPAMAGSASTGSSFMAQIVDKNGGTVLAMREWFIMTDETAPMVAGVVPASDFERLFRGHGRRTAQVFVAQFNEAMGKK